MTHLGARLLEVVQLFQEPHCIVGLSSVETSAAIIINGIVVFVRHLDLCLVDIDVVVVVSVACSRLGESLRELLAEPARKLALVSTHRTLAVAGDTLLRTRRG